MKLLQLMQWAAFALWRKTVPSSAPFSFQAGCSKASSAPDRALMISDSMKTKRVSATARARARRYSIGCDFVTLGVLTAIGGSLRRWEKCGGGGCKDDERVSGEGTNRNLGGPSL